MITKKIFCSAIFSLIIFTFVNAQTSAKVCNKSYMFSAFGNVKTDVFLSFTGENRFNKKTRLGLGYKIGVAITGKGITLPNDDVNRFKILLGFPMHVNYYIGKENNPNLLEVGTGITLYPFETYYFDTHSSEGNSVINFSFMYRYQPIKGGFTWHAGYTPVINTNKELVSCYTIGFGKTF